MSFLPEGRRPVPLSAVVKPALAGILWGVLLGGGGLWGLGATVASFGALAREEAAWEHGAVAEDHELTGKHSVGYEVFGTLEIRVRYLDAKGEAHEGERDASYFAGRFPPGESSEVRYDPDDPTQFALGWSVELASAQRRWRVIASMLWAGVVVFGAYALRKGLRTATALRAVGRDGEEVVLHVTAREPLRTGVVHRWRLASDARARGVFVARSKRQPLFLDEERTCILGLRSKRHPSAVVALGNDLAPLRYPKATVDAVRDEVDRVMLRRRSVEGA